MKRVCYCGAVVTKVPCDRCRAVKHKPRAEVYDNQWKSLSEAFRDDNPLCHDCDIEGRTTPSEDVHHKKPIRDYPELRLDPCNLVALCKKCHSRRHRCLNLTGDQMSWLE